VANRRAEKLCRSVGALLHQDRKKIDTDFDNRKKPISLPGKSLNKASGFCSVTASSHVGSWDISDIARCPACTRLTNCCVESTMPSAYERGFDVVTSKDGTAALSAEEQNMAPPRQRPEWIAVPQVRQLEVEDRSS
jgi:hypothetical protein